MNFVSEVCELLKRYDLKWELQYDAESLESDHFRAI